MPSASGTLVFRYPSLMPMELGSHLGPYEIKSFLGAGGMGEVFRARDPRIGRDVAIKVLPSLVHDEDRMRRFQQEARTVGMLNHPNLLTVYDIGSESGAPFIVMELLEGDSLRERLGEGSLPLRKAVDYAVQMARGLAAAHEKGVIHRDLKPENIFVTESEDRVKLLDFGLAKVIGSADPPSDASTMQKGTSPGMIMGTANYMSPEQVRGQQVDARSDLFSLGVVLLEMLSGRQPFRRDSQVETMNAILTADVSLDSLPIPSALGRVILHSLEKNPAHRFQSARDVIFALETFSGSFESPAPGPRKRSARAPGPMPAASAPRFQAITYRRGYIMTARFARDGSILYGAAWEDQPVEIFSSVPGDPQFRAVGIPNADLLAVSPKTGELAVSLGRRFTGGWVSEGTLARIPASGGAPREICERMQDADWTPDGKNPVLIRPSAELFIIESPVGNTIYKASHWISHLRVSPKGDLIAFLDHPLWGDSSASLRIIDFQGNVRLETKLWEPASGLAWTPKGNEIWMTATDKPGGSQNIIGITVGGKERTILSIPGWYTLHDIAPGGEVLLAKEYPRRETVVARRGAASEQNLSWLDWTFLTGISQDGSQVVFEEQRATGSALPGMYTRKTDGSPAIYLGDGRVRDVSPDGKWVLANTGLEGAYELIPLGAGGSRQIPIRGLEGAGAVWWKWNPDGKRVLLWANEPGRGGRMFELWLDGDGIPRPVGPEEIVWPMSISPDGREAVAASKDQRLVRFPSSSEGEGREIRGSKQRDQVILWGEDNALYVYQVGRIATTIERIDLETGERTDWQEIRPSDPSGIMNIQPILMSSDRSTYAYSFRRILSELYLVQGLG